MEKNILCTIYSHHTPWNIIISILREIYPDWTIKTYENDELKTIELFKRNSLYKDADKLIISYRERKEPFYEFKEDDDSPLVENLKGMYGFLTTLQTQNEKVKEQLLKKILTLNSEFSIFTEGEVKQLGELVKILALELDAVLFVSPNSLISRSKTQHFLDKNLDLIIDIEGNCDIDILEIKVESKYFDVNTLELTKDQKKRKEKSEKLLKEKNIKTNPYLPAIESEEETTTRTPKEIAQRIVVLAMTNFVAFDSITGEKAIEYLKDYNLWEYVTPKEKEFLTNPLPKRKQEETWKCECIWVLMWVLKKVEDLKFPDEMCSLNDILPEHYPVGDGKDPNLFINFTNNMRTKEEIMDMNDLYYRLDWACVDGRIHKKEVKEVHSGVVYERHYALNWLINYMGEEWDEITCDT